MEIDAKQRLLAIPILVSCLILVMIVGCGKPKPASIQISSAEATLTVGQQLEFKAVVLSAKEKELPEAW